MRCSCAAKSVALLLITLLLLGKVVASVITTRTSPVIVATLVDSAIDVLIQVALYWANQLARPEVKAAAREIYPAGRGQLEPVSVVVCAALKCAGMMAVSLQALGDLYAGDPHHGHDHHGLAHIWRRHRQAVSALALLSVLKFGFCLWCEVQFCLREVFDLMHCDHLLYEVVRAKGVGDLL